MECDGVDFHDEFGARENRENMGDTKEGRGDDHTDLSYSEDNSNVHQEEDEPARDVTS